VIRHLYFHIPFCTQRCPYCSFYVDTALAGKSPRFLDALLAELEERRAQHAIQPRTIYLGGGTPSTLSRTELQYFFDGLRERLDFSALAECTLEANPESVTPAKAQLLRELGVNRISLGVQSLDDELLKTLGRRHSAALAREKFALLRAAGFENISVDLMFALPGQTREQWRRSLSEAIALQPEHISCYCLTYEEDTAFFEQLSRGEFQQDADWDADLFELTMDTLTAAGYAQYEISNFARPGFESQHNQAYWAGATYLGLGPSAFSTIGEVRWKNIADTARYVASASAGKTEIEFTETLTPEKRLGERLAFGLRTAEGIRRSEVAPWQENIAEMLDLKLLETAGENLVLTRRGKMLADSVAEAFV
jgi:oxygen-independent coproporphyrinogen-3 oxidase